MNQDWYSQFFTRMAQELLEHIAEDMPRVVAQLMQGLPWQSLLGSSDIGKILGQLSGMPGFQGLAGMQMPRDSAYRMLGLETAASDAEVKRRYRDLAKKLHPDLAGNETTHLFLLVQAAYEQIARERGWKGSYR
jgi:DnaJ-domain-containing protein 1